MDDRDAHDAHDATSRRRLELPRRPPGDDSSEGDAGWAEGPLPGGLARPDIVGGDPAAGRPPAADAPPKDAPIETGEPGLGQAGAMPGPGAAVSRDDGPRPHFRTPEEMLAEEDWPELPGGGEIWDSAAAPGDDLASEDESAD